LTTSSIKRRKSKNIKSNCAYNGSLVTVATQGTTPPTGWRRRRSVQRKTTDSDTWCPRLREPTGIKCSKNGEGSGARRKKASTCGKLTADCHPNEPNDYMAHYPGVEHTYSHNFEPATL
ncbi:hypothetical protein LTR43_012308, partial [Exophiala xenobiotica]